MERFQKYSRYALVILYAISALTLIISVLTLKIWWHLALGFVFLAATLLNIYFKYSSYTLSVNFLSGYIFIKYGEQCLTRYSGSPTIHLVGQIFVVLGVICMVVGIFSTKKLRSIKS